MEQADSVTLKPTHHHRIHLHRPSEVTMRRARRVRAYAGLGLSQLALGSGGILARFALEGMGVYAAGAWRLALVALVLIGRFFYLKRPFLRARDELALIGAGVLLAEQSATWTLSISYLSIGTATLLYCTAPLWNGLYEVIFLRRRLPLKFWLALMLAGVGIGVMVLDGSGGPSVGAQQRVLGIGLALASGVGVAAHLIVMRRLSKRGDTQHGYATLDLLTRSYSYAAAVLIVCSFIDGTPLPPLSNWHAWGGILGMAVVTQGVGHTLQNASLKHIRASVVGFSTLLEPVIATVLAAFIFQEDMGLQGTLGIAIVLGALAWALRFTQEIETPPPTTAPGTASVTP
jgi:drug/metabolite transporter (DMT)-like permease